MAEYINKAELMEELNRGLSKTKDMMFEKNLECTFPIVAGVFEYANVTVKDLPTTEIVHCGECKWFDEGYTKCKMGNINGGNKTYFCADGEKEKRK